MIFLEATHFAAALVGLTLGLFVLVTPKGTRQHRLAGRIWVLAMLTVNGAALLSYEDGRFGIFHWLALVSQTTLALGFITIRQRKVAHHAMWMSWTWCGLMAAGAGQLAALIGLSQMWIYVAIGATVALAYWANNIREMPIKAARPFGS